MKLFYEVAVEHDDDRFYNVFEADGEDWVLIRKDLLEEYGEVLSDQPLPVKHISPIHDVDGQVDRLVSILRNNRCAKK